MAPTKLPATLVRTLRDHLVTVDGEVKKRSGILEAEFGALFDPLQNPIKMRLPDVSNFLSWRPCPSCQFGVSKNSWPQKALTPALAHIKLARCRVGAGLG